MQFELDETLIDSILYFMEDQNCEMLLDTQESELVSHGELLENESEDSNRFIALPVWDSSEGFKLMERFAVSTKNPPLKAALTKALDQKKGVFRAFKNVFGDFPEAEQLWFVFKEQNMKKHIIRWYNALREEWGLEKIGEEPEETEDLILEDFKIRRPLDADKAESIKLHQFCIEENRKFYSGNFLPNHINDFNFPLDISWVAENNSGDFAAYVLAKYEAVSVKIIALEVLPEYRGMGIGESLLNHLIAHIDKTRFSSILIDVPINSENFSKVLFRKDFAPYETRFFLNIDEDKKRT